MITCAISRLVILFFGTLYPAYASYKAVKTKNVKEYVKWMMYWIVFALFTCAETFTDVFLAFWFPFYYEIKIILVLWLLSPATRGSSILYRKFVHPQLAKREKDIDEYLNRAREHGYHAVVQLGSKGINYASQVLVQTALKGGGQIVTQLQRSYSLSDLEPVDPMLRSRLAKKAITYGDGDQSASDQVDTPVDEQVSMDFTEHTGGRDFVGDDGEPELPHVVRKHASPSPLQLSRGRSRDPVPPCLEPPNAPPPDGKTPSSAEGCRFCRGCGGSDGDTVHTSCTETEV